MSHFGWRLWVLDLSNRLQGAEQLGWMAEAEGIPGQCAMETVDCEVSK